MDVYKTRIVFDTIFCNLDMIIPVLVHESNLVINGPKLIKTILYSHYTFQLHFNGIYRHYFNHTSFSLVDTNISYYMLIL